MLLLTLLSSCPFTHYNHQLLYSAIISSNSIFNIVLLLVPTAYLTFIRRDKNGQSNSCLVGEGGIFFPQHLGQMEPGGVDDQFFENSERLDRRPAPLQLLNMDDKDIPTLVLARDKNDQFYGVVAPLPCKTTS